MAYTHKLPAPRANRCLGTGGGSDICVGLTEYLMTEKPHHGGLGLLGIELILMNQIVGLLTIVAQELDQSTGFG